MHEDALDALKMNVNPGGKWQAMRDGWWKGKPQKNELFTWYSKGMQVIVEECGVDTRRMNV